MTGTAIKTDPRLWDTVKAEITHRDKGGSPNQWSARKAQLAVAEYKKRGGGYKGRKATDNHLVQWAKQDWGTASGYPSGETHERYLPRNARASISDLDYTRTSAKKRADTAKGKQFSRQPKDIAAKVAPARAPSGQTKASLMLEARKRNIHGRSRMSQVELERALKQ